MFRYQYTAMIATSHKDENGDIISQSQTAFLCDYQPNVKDLAISVGGSSIPISFILLVPKSCIVSFNTGSDITCNGSAGTVVLAVPYKFGKIIYVKG